jgi:DNA-binding response OmpR family regulator
MYGVALIRAVRALSGRKGGETPAIDSRPSHAWEDRQRSLDAAYQMHFSKPVEISQLVERVALLARRPLSS